MFESSMDHRPNLSDLYTVGTFLYIIDLKQHYSPVVVTRFKTNVRRAGNIIVFKTVFERLEVVAAAPGLCLSFRT